MAEQQTQTQEDEKEQSLMDHLIELRDRLVHMVLAILIVFIALFAFSEDIFTIAAQPLLNLMPEGTSMIATGVTSPFLVPYRLFSCFLTRKCSDKSTYLRAIPALRKKR